MRRLFSLTLMGFLIACSSKTADAPATDPGASQPSAEFPSFSLAWSEYPSWSVFGVASEIGIIDGDKGKVGPIEERWGVDIVLREADYDTCINLYGNGEVDAAALTNMDSLIPAASRPTVAILPTSTSFGADALIVDGGIKSVDDLKGVPVYGLAKSVSEYVFARNLVIQGLNPADFTFTNMDPGAAATALQQKQEIRAIMVWNPFVLETLRRRADTHVLFDSTTIPGEVIDMVVMARGSLEKPGGENFARAVIDAYYAFNLVMADPARHNEMLVALGSKFSNLGLEDMETVVKQTKFYATPDLGLGVYDGSRLPGTMGLVSQFCVGRQIVSLSPTIGYGHQWSTPEATAPSYVFDSSYMLDVQRGGVYTQDVPIIPPPDK
ncbi:MAG: ABC transporter, periplasmic substrate-binding protein [Candidatus Uhrbacteria bacterium GW2011_GWE2_46_68]|uniref:ABC transporter, periplasmic substrate-binding protein n=2 Tax=Candidatus Uhriibacteriota TaxID=1752732 RepID=A0A0G1T5T0_9BACT|nr:MAG: ABC transporter, periplasmic substrate-binding protein [Candidatus Uhrbacteria bacterium GW2011_GWF2_46_218]KKU40760.1 MAG: ABC transporter, periplasmic substrate-binding protein [Candidatus Uhrbacteria bacterium GW2011_GWE2_46_68]